MKVTVKAGLSAVLGTSQLVTGAPQTKSYDVPNRLMNESINNIDLIALLQSRSVSEQTHYLQALPILKKAQTQSPCHQRATMSLLNDCKELEQRPGHDDPMTDEALEFQKDLYAARHAICELQRARAKIPDACSIATLSAEACEQRRGWLSWKSAPLNSPTELCYPHTNLKQVEGCLSALHSRAQDWTSFSNARQNALTMCQASRDAVEREKTLAHYRNLTEVVESVLDALFIALRDFHQDSLRRQRFAEEAELTEEKILEALRDIDAEMREYTTAIMSEAVVVQAAFSATFATARQEALEVYRDIAKAGSDFASAKDAELYALVQETLRHMGTVHAEATDKVNFFASALQELKDQAAGATVILEGTRHGAVAAQQAVHSVLGHAESAGHVMQALERQSHTTMQGIDNVAHKVAYADENVVLLNDKLEAMILRADSGLRVDPATEAAYKFWFAYCFIFIGLWATHKKTAGIFTTASGIAFMLSSATFWTWIKIITVTLRRTFFDSPKSLLVSTLVDTSPNTLSAYAVAVFAGAIAFWYRAPIATLMRTLSSRCAHAVALIAQKIDERIQRLRGRPLSRTLPPYRPRPPSALSSAQLAKERLQRFRRAESEAL